jgi:benzoyl-CoA reductase/2-hydroxyglutaryl-CoA dehydratase subunit BcrC/BadD/HgdB
VIGRDVPRELIEAAGGAAWRLTGEPGRATATATGYLGRGVDPAAASLLAVLLDGQFAGLRAIAVSADTEASRRLFYALREMRRVAPDLRVPDVHLVDVLHEPTRASRRYTVERVEEFRRTLSDWTGVDATPDRVEAAARAADDVRALLAQLGDIRMARPDAVSGDLFLAARLAGDRMPAAEHARLLREVLDVSGRRESPKPQLRIVLSGSTHDEPGVVQAIESRGAAIVADDHGS